MAFILNPTPSSHLKKSPQTLPINVHLTAKPTPHSVSTASRYSSSPDDKPLILSGFSSAFLSAAFILLSTFFTSSAGGRCSGWTPRSWSILRTARLLSICSRWISGWLWRSLSTTLWLVSSAAKSLALMVRVGRKSANGRPSCLTMYSPCPLLCGNCCFQLPPNLHLYANVINGFPWDVQHSCTFASIPKVHAGCSIKYN